MADPGGGDLAAVLSCFAQGAQGGDARGHISVVFVDSTRSPPAVYAAGREQLACTSVFFAGLFEDVPAQGGDGARSDANATGPFAVCAAGAEPSGLRRLPLPAPAAFHSLLPYLNTGDEAKLRALGAQPAPLSCDDACAVLANASFLGLPAPAVDCIMADVLAPRWPDLAEAANFRPELVSQDALSLLMRVLAERGAASDLSKAQGVLKWAHRGGWGAEQSAQLRQLLDAVGPTAALSTDDGLALAKTPVSNELLDVALPAAELRQRMLQLGTMLRYAAFRVKELTPVWCVHCQREVPLKEYESKEPKCRRRVHVGKYRVNRGWSCCNTLHKFTVGCSPERFYLHTAP